MGYGGKFIQVKEAVRGLLRGKQEVFMPLVHRVGEAQVDFGYAPVKVSGVLRKIFSQKSFFYCITQILYFFNESFNSLTKPLTRSGVGVESPHLLGAMYHL